MERSFVALASFPRHVDHPAAVVEPPPPTARIAPSRGERADTHRGRLIMKWLSRALRLSVIATIGLLGQPGKVMAATNRDLAHEIQRGRFRPVFSYRH